MIWVICSMQMPRTARRARKIDSANDYMAATLTYSKLANHVGFPLLAGLLQTEWKLRVVADGLEIIRVLTSRREGSDITAPHATECREGDSLEQAAANRIDEPVR